MTREEAITQLQDAKEGYKEYLTDEAIDMAIQALEQEPIRKRGKWEGTDEWYHRCSNCKKDFHFYIGECVENNNWNICPNCGSYNREDGE